MSFMNNGGAAFPRLTGGGLDVGSHTGMSLRDYFAAAALPALIARDAGMTKGNSSFERRPELARIAYELADAMLEERQKDRQER